MSDKHNFRVLVLHAYSAGNRGDGLLVYETLELVREAYGGQAEVKILAMDAESFGDLREHQVLQLPIAASKTSRRVRALLAMLRNPISLGFADTDLHRWLTTDSNGVIVAVGGGYMRSTSFIQSFKFALAHGTQLRYSAMSKVPSVYLSQSVGPFHGAIGSWLRRKLQTVSALLVRDDRSLSQLITPHTNAVRVPDLAVLRICKQIGHLEAASTLSGPPGHFILVLRDLTGSKSRREKYYRLCKELIGSLGNDNVILALQSVGRGNDDEKFYSRMRFGPRILSIGEALKQYERGVVISVRLHGALQSIIDGRPTIHLSYERKGFGAYEDLGLHQWVHNAYDFEPQLVISQARALAKDSRLYWQLIQRQAPAVLAKREELLSVLRNRGAN